MKKKIEDKYRKAREAEAEMAGAPKEISAAKTREPAAGPLIEEKRTARPEKTGSKKGEKAVPVWPGKPEERNSEEDRLLLPDLRKAGDYRFPPFSLLDPGKPAEKK
jgi:hypothetical protein